jgi:hypothetical protein
MLQRVELSCGACGFREDCGASAMVGYLKRARMVRAGKAPEPEMLCELLRAAAGKLSCPQCGALGLATRTLELDDEAWGQPRRCEGCSQPIGRERLAALPDTRLCAACQQGEECGAAPASQDFCSRCGTPLVVRATRGAGLTRYVSVCPSCGKK